MSGLTHIDEQGHVRMVDVTDKDNTDRIAVAGGKISMNSNTFEHIVGNKIKKGNVLETARIAGVMAAKKTSDLIPMCHPLLLTHVKVDFTLNEKESSIGITAEARLRGRTGVEMEALTAASVAALTIYDMAKALDKGMVIDGICLLSKEGGKSGRYDRDAAPAQEGD